MKTEVVKRCVDLGWPDTGHDEYFLVRSVKRRSKFLQWLLGNKEFDLMAYGERKPGQHEVNKDILRYGNK